MEERNNEVLRLRTLFDYFSPYVFLEERLKSFTKKWPHKSANLLPLKMAEAGFYYTPDPIDNGCVKCPFCLKELNGWEDDDNPIEEHRRYKDRCYFARLDKREEDYTVRDVLLLLINTRAAVLEQEAYDTLARVEQAYERMVEKAERKVEKLCKEANANPTHEDTKKGRKKKLK